MNYKNIIFDLDGTLVNTSPDINASVNYVLKKLELPLCTLEQCKSYVGEGLKKTLSNALDARDYKYSKEELNKLYQEFEDYYRDHATDESYPYEGIIELLDSLKSAGHIISVISNKEDSLAKKVIADVIPNFKFDSIWGIGNGKKKKPDTEGYNWTKNKLQIKDSDVLFIGDSAVDRQFAINCELEYKLVTWGFLSKDKLVTLDGENRLVNSTKELHKEIQ